MREALKGLATRKLVRSNQRSGTVVLPRDEWQWWDLDVITWISENETRDSEFILQLIEVRLGVEPMAAALAAKKATEEDFATLTACIKNLEQALDTDDEKVWAQADHDFHQSIFAASHNHLMISLIEFLHKGIEKSRESTFPEIKEYTNSPQDYSKKGFIERHRSLLQAILARDENLAHQKMADILLHLKGLFEYKEKQ